MRLIHALCILTSAATCLSAEPEWEPVATRLLEAEDEGYGGLCGIAVDHKTGDVIVNLSDLGLFRSKDLGESWERTNDMPIKGRTESPGCLSLDPTEKSKTIVSAFVYGSPVGVSTDGGKSFRFMDKQSAHVDWCAVDWTDRELEFALALKHEMGGLLIASPTAEPTIRPSQRCSERPTAGRRLKRSATMLSSAAVRPARCPGGATGNSTG